MTSTPPATLYRWRGFVGAAVGLDLAAAVTGLRWLSWRPYGAWMIPVDAAVLVAGGALAFALLLPLAARFAPAVAAPALTAALALALWITALSGAEIPPLWALANGAALLLVAGYASALSERRGGERIAFEVFSAIVAAALGVSLAFPDGVPGISLALPGALVLLLLIGPRGPQPRSLAARLVFAAPALALIAFCALVPPPGSRPETVAGGDVRSGDRSLVLIVLDTLRRDHLSLHGYERETTPHLERWARDALVFDDATATSSWTLPTHASIFTGLYPRSHGAHGYRSAKKKNSTYALRPDVKTLAEVARDAGLATGAVVANHYFLGPEFGVDQGFETYWLPRPRRGFRFAPSDALAERLARDRWEQHHWPDLRARFVSDAAIAWIRAQRDAPYFLFVNYLDVHRPNRRPATDEIPLEDEIEIPRYFPALTKVFEHEPLADEVVRGLVNSYDRELVHLDRELARLLRFLERDGRAARTAVIVTSDHGEFFGEHDLVDHMVHLYNEVVDVPLLVKGPGVEPGRRSEPVQSVDLFPTALELLGIDADAAPSQGTSVLRADRHPIVSEWYAAANGRLREPRYRGRFERNLATIRGGDLRLFRHEDGVNELYDLARDPRETRDLAAERPEDVQALEHALADWRRRHPPASAQPLPDPTLSEEQQRQLRELGYAD